MACETLHCWWTFSGLVGAFLDLAIVYLLLCASTLAYFASKFLGIFGLCLPCPCNGLFGAPNSNYCAQRLLVDCATGQVSNVHLSVKSKFPFDSTSSKGQDCHLSTKLVREGKSNVKECVEMNDESSCSSTLDARKSRNVIVEDSGARNETEFEAVKQGVKEGRLDLKGKRIIHQRAKGGIRRRKKGGVDYGKYSSVSSYDPPCADVRGLPQSPCSINMEENDRIESSSVPFESGVDTNCLYYDGVPATVTRLGERVYHSFELNERLDENKDNEKNLSSFHEPKVNGGRGQGVDNDEKNIIRVLEQALEEEQAARATLYLELEKERNAAATAADEAMAMILRLQEEKASIEMEARQYQRIIEEKSAYDAEEMNILKEILVRREREKLFLEKEVEGYRQMIFPEGEGLENDTQHMGTQGQQLDSSLLDLGGDPVMMLHQLSQSIDKEEVVIKKCSDDVLSVDKRSYIHAIDKELPIQGWEGDDTFTKQDLDKHSLHLPEKTIALVGEEQEQNSNSTLAQGEAMKMTETEIYRVHSGENLKQQTEDECHGNKEPLFDKEPRIQNVHMINDESSLCKESSKNRSNQLLMSDAPCGHINNDLSPGVAPAQGINIIKDYPSTSILNTEPDLKRSTLDMVIGLPPTGPRARYKLSDWQRSSLPVADNEKLKIDNEVGWLRDRLRIVQEGRQKLNLSLEHRESEKLQFHLLEDILHRLWEIRQLTEAGKTRRQTSLPPPSSKVTSKKRRCRSSSLGV